MQIRQDSGRFVLRLILLLVGLIPSRAQSGTTEAWVTNGSKRMEYQAQKDLERSSQAAARITLQPEQTYQTIDGFGWMLNQGSAKLLMQLPANTRHAILEELFGAEGLNASMVRVAIGACDLS